LESIQQVVQDSLLCGLGKQVKLIQHKDDSLMPPAMSHISSLSFELLMGQIHIHANDGTCLPLI
jgi:hypothetical protein